jgi:hypothetical protein
MPVEFVLDTSKFEKSIAKYELSIGKATKKGCMDIGNEVLRLGEREVPHDLGLLQGSGHVEPLPDGAIVGYNKVYAARLHEHPEYTFQKGRKGKYLEDPIVNNLTKLREILGSALNGVSN